MASPSLIIKSLRSVTLLRSNPLLGVARPSKIMHFIINSHLPPSSWARICWLLLFSAILAPTHVDGDQLRQGDETVAAPLKVAVIGAGSGGASAAYYAHKYASQAGLNADITVFERSPYVGGRSTTVDVYSDPSEPVELGASIFVEVNKNLVSAVKELGLETQAFPTSRREDSIEKLGIWNGEKFVIIQSTGSSKWWNIGKILWKYGLAPIRAQMLMRKTVAKFLSMYEQPHFPFRSLSRVVQDVELDKVTSSTGEQFLEENAIGKQFSTDIVQASTRVNYAQNLGLIHGLETMVCLATEGAMAVKGGNWQIFDRMLQAADADVRLNTSVTKIVSTSNKGFNLQWETPKEDSRGAHQTHGDTDDFDAVVIAAPLQFSNLTMPSDLPRAPDTIPYVSLHVTLFATPHELSPVFFNRSPELKVPDSVLTTLGPTDHPGRSRDGVGAPGFFSVSLQRTLTNPRVPTEDGQGRKEHLYKVFSPNPLSPSFLTSLLGLPLSESGAHSLEDISKEHISWFFHKQWHSYPYLYPRVTFEDPELARGLWYTSGMESFISTMETSSLMGMNVARLLVDDRLGVVRSAAVVEGDHESARSGYGSNRTVAELRR